MERICRGQNPPLRQNLPRFKSSVIQYIRLNIQQDQVIYFSGFFIVGGGGDFIPSRYLPSPMYIITSKIHID